MTNEMQGLDEFDLLLNDVLQTMANPEMPERVRVNVRTRVWVRELAARPKPVRAAVVFSPAAFQERMNPKRSTASTMWALGAHAAAIALLFWVASVKMAHVYEDKQTQLTELAPPPVAPLKKDVMGGGGGQKGPTPVSKGELPKFADSQITPPKAPPLIEPKIKMPDATIEVQKDLKMADNNMPTFGMPNSPLLGASMGNGNGTGIGSGSGSGLGPGSGGNTGGGPKHIGGGVSAPVLVFSPDPEFSEEARKAKFMGIVTVNLWVDEKGNPTHVRVLHGVGMGLDEKALAAVKQYKFKPAMEGGKPVTVELNVEVNFQIF
jgi:periplasmic protein TonB